MVNPVNSSHPVNEEFQWCVLDPWPHCIFYFIICGEMNALMIPFLFRKKWKSQGTKSGEYRWNRFEYQLPKNIGVSVQCVWLSIIMLPVYQLSGFLNMTTRLIKCFNVSMNCSEFIVLSFPASTYSITCTHIWDPKRLSKEVFVKREFLGLGRSKCQYSMLWLFSSGS